MYICAYVPAIWSYVSYVSSTHDKSISLIINTSCVGMTYA